MDLSSYSYEWGYFWICYFAWYDAGFKSSSHSGLHSNFWLHHLSYPKYVLIKCNVSWVVKFPQHTFILEYFNISNFLLILPFSLSRYSSAPKTKTIFQMLWYVFEIIQCIHFYSLFLSLTSESLMTIWVEPHKALHINSSYLSKDQTLKYGKLHFSSFFESHFCYILLVKWGKKICAFWFAYLLPNCFP